MAHEASKIEPEFKPGTILGERFHLLRQIGAGGMGTVYEALDLKVQRKVALKCARAGHHFRLSRETRAAAEVSHFNVCKIHDIHTLSTPQGDRDCISMEMIEGETLSARIRRAGPLDSKQAIAITEQICAGLAQSHSQGVVHGDLKCGNIMLDSRLNGQIRAVITDFGMAHLDGEAASAGGTPDYMAPEQLQGSAASRLSDVYSLGVVLHFMLTGRVPAYEVPPPVQPRRQAAQLTTVTLGRSRAKTDSAEDRLWRRKIDRLPGRWAKTVNRCLAATPADRFPAATAVAKSLHPSRWLWRGAAALGIVLAMFAGEREWQARQSQTPVRLEILPFEGSAAAEGKGVGDEIAERLNGARRRFTVTSSPQDNPATHRLHVRLDSEGGARFHAVVQLVDVPSGLAIRELQGDYAASETATLAKAIVGIASEAFHLPASARETVEPAAYANYARGLDALRQQDVASAVAFFETAVQADPRSALPYAGLAEAYLQRAVSTGSPDLERAEAAVAQGTRINPDAPPVLLASGLALERRGKYEFAVRQFTRATEVAAENGEAWGRLAHAYSLTGRTADSVAIYRKAIELEPGDYRLYQALGRDYFQVGQYSEAAGPLQKAAELAPGLSQVHEELGGILLQLGRTHEAETELLLALKQRPSRNLHVNIGALYYSLRRYQEAAAEFERSFSYGTPVLIQYRNLGDAYRQLGRKPDAMTAYKEAERLAEAEVVQNPRSGRSHAQLGLLRAFLGNRSGAALEISQALALEPDSRYVMRDSAIGFEFLGNRENALSVLKAAPGDFLRELSRHPDLKALVSDQRFSVILPSR